MALTIEQQQAIAIAQARRRRAEAENQTTPQTTISQPEPTYEASDLVSGLAKQVKGVAQRVYNDPNKAVYDAVNYTGRVARDVYNNPADAAMSAASGIARATPQAVDFGAALVAKGGNMIEQGLGTNKNVPLSDYMNMAPLNSAMTAVVGEEYKPQTEGGEAVKFGASLVSPLGYAKAAPIAGKAIYKSAEKVLSGADTATQAVAKPIAGAGRMVRNAVVGRSADDVFSDVIARSRLTPEQIRQGVAGGQISTIADIAGDEVQGLTRALGKVEGARNLISDALEGRSDAAVSRVVGQLSKNISSVDTYFGNLDDIAKARAAVAKPLYEKAYAEGADIASPSVKKFLSDARIQQATAEAKKSYGVRLEAKPNSLEALDGAKKVLDDQIGVAVRAGESNKVRALSDFRNQFVSALDEAVPAYKEPRRVFSGFAKLQEAQEAGLKFKSLAPEQIQKQLKAMTPDQREAYRIGVRQSLQSEVAKTADGADPAKRIFGNSFEREQLEAVLGKGEQFDDFAKRMREEITAANTKFRVLGGSRTDINTGADEQLAQMAVQIKNQGLKGAILDRAITSISDGIARRYFGINKANAEAIARALVDRKAGLEALDKIIAKQSGKQAGIMRQAVEGLRSFGVQKANPSAPSSAAFVEADKTNSLSARPEATIAALGLSGGLGAANFASSLAVPPTGPAQDAWANKGPQDLSQVPTEVLMQQLQQIRAPMPAPVSQTFLISEEGFRPTAYKDSVGITTIGYGFNLEQPNARDIIKRVKIPESYELLRSGQQALSDESARKLFDYKHRKSEQAAAKIVPNYNSLGENQRAALTSMVYHMGGEGVRKFKKTLAYLADGNARAVENQLLTSEMARQTPARARRTALMLAYNLSPQEAEQRLVEQGRIDAGERKYAAPQPQAVAPQQRQRVRYNDAKRMVGLNDA